MIKNAQHRFGLPSLHSFECCAQVARDVQRAVVALAQYDVDFHLFAGFGCERYWQADCAIFAF